MTDNKDEIQWFRQPAAEAYVADQLKEFLTDFPSVQAFSQVLLERTSSHLSDWLDHLVLADGDQIQSELKELGFQPEVVEAEPGDTVYHHPGAILPRLVLRTTSNSEPGSTLAVAIQVEDIGFFLMANQVSVPIEGTLASPFRQAKVWETKDRALLVVERRGHPGFVPVSMPPDYAQLVLQVFERWATRPRLFADAREGMNHTLALARALTAEIGTDAAAWVAFAAERTYWEQRNRAGQVQKSRQDSLGLGWANHDHHTFRSSRDVFPILIEILETFGFHPRERFYAGAQAGWGAQVMEQPTCRFAVFADVDLSPEEVEGDFAHRPLMLRQELGTVGLWCALHGEAMLSSGLHHLAARFDFDRVTQDLDARDIRMMSPFSEFPYLRQAFTRGERWKVAPNRLERLSETGQIDAAQQAQFASQGAIGSHLENIQRAEGFKGFNQERISDIIRRTDPRFG